MFGTNKAQSFRQSPSPNSGSAASSGLPALNRGESLTSIDHSSSHHYHDRLPRPEQPERAFSAGNSVSFRHLATSDTSASLNFVRLESRPVLLTQDEVGATEIAQDSRLAQAGTQAALPMAQDNDRFFAADGVYRPLLNEAMQMLDHDAAAMSYWTEPGTEVTGLLGWLWRLMLRWWLLWTNSVINRLQYTRGIQRSVPFLTAYEAHTLVSTVRSLEYSNAAFSVFSLYNQLRLGFKNRNTSRVLVQNVRSGRWDSWWHMSTQVTWSRLFDLVGQLPFIGITRFPATENFPSSKGHALRAIFRHFWSGSWLTRFLTCGAQGLVVYQNEAPAVNLAAQSTGLEEAFRNQFGTHIGRLFINAFGREHRLTVDESIVRTFVTSPTATMVNRGAEHVLRCLAKHWRNMLFQENGNFAHQRMEQLDVFETMRVHLPLVLSTLANLRGRNEWDTRVLGPYLAELQSFDPVSVDGPMKPDVEHGFGAKLHDKHHMEIMAPCQAAERILRKMKKENMIHAVCGGLSSRKAPLEDWIDAIIECCDRLSQEAEEVRAFVATVDTGIKLGFKLLQAIDWRVPSSRELTMAVIAHIRKEHKDSKELPCECISLALDKLATKDARMLKEFVMQRMEREEVARLLLTRVETLLLRELRRVKLDRRIRMLSVGKEATAASLEQFVWYWVKVKSSDFWRVHVFREMSADQTSLIFVEVDTNTEQTYDITQVEVWHYVPIAEAITRAQKAFMTIELDYGKRFTYSNFMEFGSPMIEDSLRTRLQRLAVVAQVHCHELDKARLKVLTETRNSVKLNRVRGANAACPPQSTIVLGAGPTGLMLAIHSVQNVLFTGGEVKIYESRDATKKGAASNERAQIVRLDSRQIAILRYHLGCGYEDVFVPAMGETNPHLGNTIPIQGFVEVTIKRLEYMLSDEAAKMRSRNLLQYFSGNKIKYDVKTGTLSKKGASLNHGDDVVLGPGDVTWRIADFRFSSQIDMENLVVGGEYDIIPPRSEAARLYRLEQMDLAYDWYFFVAQQSGCDDIACTKEKHPPIFQKGAGRVHPHSIVLRSTWGAEKEIKFDDAAEKDYVLDTSSAHIIIATGKPHGSTEHFRVTTEQEYAVCCLEGLKVSMGMHNLGVKRWGAGIIDDFRSHTDENTRIVGDFMKSVALIPIVRTMHRKAVNDPIWKSHFEWIPEQFGEAAHNILETITVELDHLANVRFTRERLQTRFFELGDNFYLGMEIATEFNSWKLDVANRILGKLPVYAAAERVEKRKKCMSALNDALGRLWYESTLDVIAKGDVYNPGGRSYVPRLFTIDSRIEAPLGTLEKQDAFKLPRCQFRVDSRDGMSITYAQGEPGTPRLPLPTQTKVKDATGVLVRLESIKAGATFEAADTFEIIKKTKTDVVVRSSDGYLATLAATTKVFRANDLARSPDGVEESFVALGFFPVAHYVCHRALQVSSTQIGQESGSTNGFITAHVGDAQASPHFMRYSGLTGACINAMSFNNMVGQALVETSFEERTRRYAFETHWSNGEVVQRGTGSNYGEDGFLRPGFTYQCLVDYLYARALENRMIDEDVDDILSRDWKVKVAASLVPRGLENDALFMDALFLELHDALHRKFVMEVCKKTGNEILDESLMDAIADEMARATSGWQGSAASVHFDRHEDLGDISCNVLSVATTLKRVADYSIELRLRDERISVENHNQPKPVDSLVDDFAVEAQSHADSLIQSTAFATGAIALRLHSATYSGIVSTVLGFISIGISFGTIANVSRYKNRNEEARRQFAEAKFPRIAKSLFALMSSDARNRASADNPFISELEMVFKRFMDNAVYYGYSTSELFPFEQDYSVLKRSINHESAVIHFMRLLLQKYIPKTFHENSYVQEDLVKIYKCLHEMLRMNRSSASAAGAESLFKELLAFLPVLEKTIEHGPVKFGFLRVRPLARQAFPVTLQRLLAPMLPAKYIDPSRAKALEILHKAEEMQQASPSHKLLSREVRDLKELHYATAESQNASMIFASSTIVFFTSIVFTAFRLLSIVAGTDDPDDAEKDANNDEIFQFLLDLTGWAAVASLFGSLLALQHFFRKMGHLVSLQRALRGSGAGAVAAVRNATHAQMLLTSLRMVAVACACIALPWSAVAQMFDLDDTFMPQFLAFMSVLTAAGSHVILLVVEFLIRYNLEPDLGPVVWTPFRRELDDIKRQFTVRDATDVETIQTLEREAWEYTAREFLHRFRFDVVFAADRFGTVLQHIQGGDFTKVKDV